MKKIFVLIIFGLGILLGFGSTQVYDRYQELRSPVLQDSIIDMDALIGSIGDVVKANTSVDRFQKYDRFEEISSLLGEAYIDETKLDSGYMLESALKAFVDAIQDPYTVYMDAQTQSGFEGTLKGTTNFEGIGAVVRKKEYYVLIEELLKESPAFKAGLKPLDRILAVDSGSVKDLDINQAVEKIKGPKGTQVHLLIERVDRKDETKKEFLEKLVTREKMLLPSVKTEIIPYKNKSLAYINITTIGEETEALFKREIRLLEGSGFDAVILDLRGNGGGFLSIGVEIASHFVPKGAEIVSAKYRIRPDETFVSQGYGGLEGYPVVVLVDEFTASAGEIIALALQEQIGAKIVGANTFGKGSIQTMDIYPDGASLKYTIGKRYAPSGKNIDMAGIAPDVQIELDVDKYINEDIDIQLDKAKEIVISLF